MEDASSQNGTSAYSERNHHGSTKSVQEKEEYFCLNANKDGHTSAVVASVEENVSERASICEDSPDDCDSGSSYADSPGGCLTSFRRWRRSAEDSKSWFLLFAVVVPVNILNGMEIVSFSLYYVEYANYFHENTRFAIGAIVAIKSAMTSFSGIFTSVLINRYGCRVVSLASGGLMFSSLLISSFANHIVLIQVTQGFVLGIGSCFCNLSLNIITQQNFTRNRALAAGIEMLGITVGNLSGTYLINYLLTEYSWRGTVRIHAAMMANIIPLSLLMPKHIRSKSETEESTQSTLKKVGTFFKDIFDFTLFKNAPFTLIAFGAMLQKFNGQTLLQHITSRVVFLGMSRTDGANVLVAATIGIVFTRLIVTFTANLRCSRRIIFFIVGCFVGGVSSFLIVVLKTLWGQLFGSAVAGVHVGLTNTVFTVMMVDLMGVSLLARSLALCNALQGITNLICAPIGGLLYDVTGSYDPPFVLAGVCGVVSGILVLTAAFLDRFNKRKNVPSSNDAEVTTKV